MDIRQYVNVLSSGKGLSPSDLSSANAMPLSFFGKATPSDTIINLQVSTTHLIQDLISYGRRFR